MRDIGTAAVARSASQTPARDFAIALASDSAWSLVASTARSWFGRSPRRLDWSAAPAAWP